MGRLESASFPTVWAGSSAWAITDYADLNRASGSAEIWPPVSGVIKLLPLADISEPLFLV